MEISLTFLGFVSLQLSIKSQAETMAACQAATLICSKSLFSSD